MTVAVVVTDATPGFGVAVIVKDFEAPGVNVPAVHTALAPLLMHPVGSPLSTPFVSLTVILEPAGCVRLPVFVMVAVAENAPRAVDGAATDALTFEMLMIAAHAGAV